MVHLLWLNPWMSYDIVTFFSLVQFHVAKSQMNQQRKHGSFHSIQWSNLLEGFITHFHLLKVDLKIALNVADPLHAYTNHL